MPQITPEFIISAVIRRRWLIMVPLSVALVVGIYLSVTLPKVYESSTLILIEGQSVPQAFVRSIVNEDTASRISTISQQILSRTNLEKIINDFKLYSGPNTNNLYMEDKLQMLRKQIDIQVTRGQGRQGDADAFSISFKGSDPTKVMTITNTLASYFIDTNLKVREEQSIGTSNFLDAELESSRKRLEQVEENIKEYRENNMGELPEQLQSNLAILSRMQENLTDRRQSLRNLKLQLAELQSQSANREPSVVIVGGDQRMQNETVTIDTLRAQLETLRSRYTEKHPDVQRLKQQILDLEANEQSGTQANNTPRSTQPTVSPEIQRQIIDMQNEIRSAESEIIDLDAEITKYQNRVENTPKREQELLSLRRDYDNIQASYDSLLTRKLEADIAVNMERKQKGEQFRIVDPARLPQKPISPDEKKLILMAIAAGLGIGCGIVFLIELFFQTYRNPEDLEKQSELPVLAAIPQLLQKKQIYLKRLNAATSMGYLIVIFMLMGIAGFVSLKGTEPLLEIIHKII